MSRHQSAGYSKFKAQLLVHSVHLKPPHFRATDNESQEFEVTGLESWLRV